MYGHRSAGFFGYSHMTGGFEGGQSDYVRVPFGGCVTVCLMFCFILCLMQ